MRLYAHQMLLHIFKSGTAIGMTPYCLYSEVIVSNRITGLYKKASPHSSGTIPVNSGAGEYDKRMDITGSDSALSLIQESGVGCNLISAMGASFEVLYTYRICPRG
jgi:hypothetical protein